jgi:hypothetical protein
VNATKIFIYIVNVDYLNSYFANSELTESPQPRYRPDKQISLLDILKQYFKNINF